MCLILRPNSKCWYIKFKYLGKPYYYSSHTKDKNLARSKERADRAELERQAHKNSLLSEEDRAEIERSKRRQEVPKLKDFIAVPDAKIDFAGGEFWTEHATNHYPNPDSKAVYRTRCRTFSAYSGMADERLCDITPAMLLSFVNYRLGQGRKPATIDVDLAVLHVALSIARDQLEYIKTVPKFPERLDDGKGPGIAITPEEEEVYMAAAAAYDRQLHIFSSIMIDTGLEPEVVSHLDWKDVHIEPTEEHIHGWIHGDCQKAGTRERDMPMTPRLLSLVMAWWMDAGCPKTGWVFPHKDDPTEHTASQTFRWRHRQLWERSEEPITIRQFRLYDFRHTVLTRLGEGGANEWEIMSFAGWTSIKQAKRYVKTNQQTRVRASLKLVAVLAKLPQAVR